MKIDLNIGIINNNFCLVSSSKYSIFVSPVLLWYDIEFNSSCSFNNLFKIISLLFSFAYFSL